MARIIFQISLSFFIMTAAFSLVAAAPTQSPPAARATSQAPAAPIPESPATSFSLNQSYCSSNSIDSSFATSLCFGQWTVIKYLEVNSLHAHACTCYYGIPVLLFFQRALVDHEQCSNRSLPITQAVGNMQRIFCGASTAGGSSKMSLHVITSVLLTYHSVIVKAATHQASERTNSTTTEIVTEILKGLIQNYFRVVSTTYTTIHYNNQHSSIIIATFTIISVIHYTDYRLLLIIVCAPMLKVALRLQICQTNLILPISLTAVILLPMFPTIFLVSFV